MSGFLDTVFLDNTLVRWLIAAAFMCGGFFAGKLLALVMRLIVGAVLKKRGGINPVIRSLERPAALLVFLLGLVIGLKALRLGETVRLWTGRALDSFLVIIITWALTRVIDAAIVRLPRWKAGPDTESRILPLLQKLAGTVLWLIAVVLILRTLGYNVSALLAGLGLGGAALALASKDTLSNFFGSFTVFLDKPFRINDRIKIGDYDGVITEMGLRTSRLRTLENRTVFIPNSFFASHPIENVSAQPHIKVVQSIRFKGDNGSEKIARGLEIIRETAAGVPGLEEKAIAGLVSAGGVICLANFIYFVSKEADYNETVNRVNMELLRRFEAEEIRLA